MNLCSSTGARVKTARQCCRMRIEGPGGNSAERALGHKSPGSKDDYNKQQDIKQIKEVIFPH